jgi:hypothetical protein
MSDIGTILRTVAQDEQLAMENSMSGDASMTPAASKVSSSSEKRIGEATRAKPLTKQERKRAM